MRVVCVTEPYGNNSENHLKKQKNMGTQHYVYSRKWVDENAKQTKKRRLLNVN